VHRAIPVEAFESHEPTKVGLSRSFQSSAPPGLFAASRSGRRGECGGHPRLEAKRQEVGGYPHRRVASHQPSNSACGRTLLEARAINLASRFRYRGRRREQRNEAFNQSWVSQNGVTQSGVWQPGAHRDLHGSHDFGRTNAQGREAEDALALNLNQRFEKSACFRKRGGTHDRFHRNLEQAITDTLGSCFLFTQPDAGKLRVGKQAKRNLPSRGHAFAAGDAGMDHAKVVEANVGKLRAARHLADRPNPGRSSLQPLVYLNVSSIGEFDAG